MTILVNDMFGIGRRLQGVIAVCKPVDYDVLARQSRIVEIGPSSRDALVRIAITKLRIGSGIWMSAFDIDQTEGLFMADLCLVAIGSE